MQINFNWGSSITGAANAAQIEGAFEQAAQNLENLFSNPVTITIDAEWATINSGAVAENFSNFAGYYKSYAQFVSALTAEASQNPVAAIALASLPATDPFNNTENGDSGYWISDAEVKALGLGAADSTEVDSTLTLNSNPVYLNSDGSTSPAGYAWGPGQSGYDPVGAIEHEISEIMGRVGSFTFVVGGPTQLTPLDLFRYLPNDTRDYGLYVPNTQSVPGNFSIDGQVLSQLQYPTPNFAVQTPYDNYDWYSSFGTGNDDFGSAPEGYGAGYISLDDIEEMQVLGWDLTNAGGIISKTSGPATVGPGQTISYEQVGDVTFTVAGQPVIQIAELDVSGSTSGMEVGEAGTELVLQGGYALETLVGSGGNQTIGDGGGGSETLVYSGGVEAVSSGGNSFSTEVFRGGTQDVYSGGASYNTKASNSGTQNVYGGTTNFSIVSSGGVQNVLAGGVGVSTVFSGGTQNVAGVASGGIVQDGIQNVASGGVAIGATVEDEVVYPPQGSLSTDPYASTFGYQFVSSGGVASRSIVELGGTLVVYSGGKAVNTTISGTNFSGPPVSGPVTSLPQGLDIVSGTQEVQSGGSAVGTQVEAYGLQEVFAGGSVSGTALDNFGQTVLAGGAARATVVSSGGALEGSGTATGSIVFAGGTEDVTSAIGCTLSGGTEIVGAYCVASNTNILAGGVQTVAGGAAAGAVLNGGTQYVNSGNFFAGIVTGSAIGTQVNSGGQEYVFYRDVTSNTIIAAGGAEYVSSGGTAIGTVVRSGGVEQVFSGGIASGSVISGGLLMLSGGAVVTDGVDFAGAGELVIGGTSSPGGAISGLGSGDKIDLAGLAFVAGASASIRSGNILVVVDNGVSYDLQLNQNPGLGFSVMRDSGTGTLVTTTPPIPPSANVTSVASVGAGQTIALSNLVTVSDPDSVGYQTLQLWDTNGTAIGGEFLINGTPQTAGRAINVPSGANVVFDAGTGSGTDTLWAQLVQSNGAVAGWEKFTVTVPAPTLSVMSAPNATAGAQLALSSLVVVSDPSNAAYQLQLWDSDGAVAGGEFLINGTPQTGGHAINLPSGANVVFDAGTSAGTDTLWAELVQSNGTATGWEKFAITVPEASITVPSQNPVAPRQTIALSNIFTISDPGNVGYETLELWDSNGTPATGQFVVNGVPQTGGHAINVTPANCANTIFDVGILGGSDIVWAKLVETDGTSTGWDAVAVTAPEVPLPTLSTTSDGSATSRQTLALSSLVTNSDPNGVGYQTLQLWDSDGTAAGGEFLINGVAQSGGHAINVPAGANVVFDPGASAGTDTLWAQLIEINGAESGWKEFTVTVPAPTLSVTSVPNTMAGAQIALSTLVTVSDPSNATYQLQLWDSDGTVAGGEFLINGTPQTAGHAINVPAGANVVFDAGTSAGTDTLWAQLIQDNGTANGWDKLTVTVPNPTVAVSNYTTATPGQTIALSNLVTISNPGNVGYQKLELWDSDGTMATGQFVVGGVSQTGGHEIDVSPANIAGAVFDEGTIGNTDTLWAQLMLNNGTTTGWEKFTVVDPVTINQGATLELSNAYAGHAIFAGNSGTLQLDDSADFNGTIAGMTGADTLDLSDIGFGRNTTLEYTANAANTGGSLSVSDGTHLAQIALLGQYVATSFATASDGHGGTLISESVLPGSSQAALSLPHQA